MKRILILWNMPLLLFIPLLALLSGCAVREAARPEVSASPPTLTPAAAAIVGLVPAETEAPKMIIHGKNLRRL